MKHDLITPPATELNATLRGRVLQFDGLRAVAFLSVFVNHATHLPLLWAGVDVFFVLSGFLITGILLERKRLGEGYFSYFYKRRVFRILPAYVLAIVLHGVLITWSQYKPLWLFLLAPNVQGLLPNGPGLLPIWSLAVEEQFYFVWPLTLCALGAMRGMRAAAIVAVICPLVRFASWQFHWQEELVGSSFPTIADALATGCLLAGWQERLARVRWYARFLQSWWIWSVPVVLFAVLQLGSRPRISGLVGQSLEHLGIAIILDRCVRFPHGRTGTFLNTKPMVLFGGWTYSIYLWQQLFLDRFSGHVWNAFPLNLGLAVLVGAASFYFVERPVLAWRERLMAATKKASNSLAAAPPATAAGATHLAAAAAAAGGRQSTR